MSPLFRRYLKLLTLNECSMCSISIEFIYIVGIYLCRVFYSVCAAIYQHADKFCSRGVTINPSSKLLDEYEVVEFRELIRYHI